MKKRKELTDKQISQIKRLRSKYSNLIQPKNDEIHKINKEVASLEEKKKAIIKERNSLNTELNRKITAVKDSEREKVFKNISFEEGDEFIFDLNGTASRMGSITLFGGFKLRIEGETPTQFRMSIHDKSDNFEFYNNTGYSSFIETNYFNIKKINFKEFVYENSKSLRRKIIVSKIVE